MTHLCCVVPRGVIDGEDLNKAAYRQGNSLPIAILAVLEPIISAEDQ